MKRTLIVLVVGLLVIGCLTPEQKRPGVFRIPPEALRDSVVGEYELKGVDEYTDKLVFLENGIVEWHRNSKKQPDNKWSIVDGEIHAKYDSGAISVCRINTDKSITLIAYIEDGKREDYSKEEQDTYKKIK